MCETELRFERFVVGPESCLNYERAVGDIDGDGRNEVVATSQGAEDEGMPGLVWFRHPEWSMQPLISFDDCSDGYSHWRGDDLRLADIDGDGNLDIVGGVSDSIEGGTRLVWWQNPGSGRATSATWRRHSLASDASDYVKNLGVADVDGDGRLDVIARCSNRLYVYFQDAPDSWTVRSWEIADYEGLAVGDIAGNGRCDIAVNGRWYEAPADPRSGEYVEHVYAQKWLDPPPPAESWQARGVKVVVADITGDGTMEIVVAPAEYASKSMPVAWYSRGESLGEPWVEHVVEADVRQAHTLQVVDFNGDGRLDILCGAMARDDNPDRGLWVYLQGPDASFTRIDIQTGGETPKGSYSAVVGDLDGDGGMDVVNIPNFDQPPTEVWLNRMGRGTGSSESG